MKRDDRNELYAATSMAASLAALVVALAVAIKPTIFQLPVAAPTPTTSVASANETFNNQFSAVQLATVEEGLLGPTEALIRSRAARDRMTLISDADLLAELDRLPPPAHLAVAAPTARERAMAEIRALTEASKRRVLALEELAPLGDLLLASFATDTDASSTSGPEDNSRGATHRGTNGGGRFRAFPASFTDPAQAARKAAIQDEERLARLLVTARSQLDMFAPFKNVLGPDLPIGVDRYPPGLKVHLIPLEV